MEHHKDTVNCRSVIIACKKSDFYEWWPFYYPTYVPSIRKIVISRNYYKLLRIGLQCMNWDIMIPIYIGRSKCELNKIEKFFVLLFRFWCCLRQIPLCFEKLRVVLSQRMRACAVTTTIRSDKCALMSATPDITQ